MFYNYPPWALNLAKYLPSSLKKKLRKHPALRKKLMGLTNFTRTREVDINKILLGGDGYISAFNYAILTDQFLRPSTPIANGPHVRLLQEYEKNPRLLDTESFQNTPYHANILHCMKYTGHYFNSTKTKDTITIAKAFLSSYETDKALQAQGKKTSFDKEGVILLPIKYSSYYQLYDGHHKAAKAFMLGRKKIRALICKHPVVTPVQDLLLNVLWLEGRREIYQPVDLPEVKEGWTLVRKCTDRLEGMKSFLKENRISAGSYLDIGCSYGWFVKGMQEEGMDAYGVDRDYFGRQVGLQVYGIQPEKFFLSDTVNFLEGQTRTFDVVSCLSIMHHYIMNDCGTSPEQLIKMIDAITGKVLFFETAHPHEGSLKEKLHKWDEHYILGWLKENTRFKRVEIISRDGDGTGKFKNLYARTLFACTR